MLVTVRCDCGYVVVVTVRCGSTELVQRGSAERWRSSGGDERRRAIGGQGGHHRGPQDVCCQRWVRGLLPGTGNAPYKIAHMEHVCSHAELKLPFYASETQKQDGVVVTFLWVQECRATIKERENLNGTLLKTASVSPSEVYYIVTTGTHVYKSKKVLKSKK